MSFCVMVEHQERDEWAAVLLALRTDEGRRIFAPLVFSFTDSDVFGPAPCLEAWQAAGNLMLYSAVAKDRTKLLKQAVASFAQHVEGNSNVLQRARVGQVSKIKAEPYATALPNFEMSKDAFRWLYESPGGEPAVVALAILNRLVQLHHLDQPTQSEREAAAVRRVLTGR
jgi:hypothetical protein